VRDLASKTARLKDTVAALTIDGIILRNVAAGQFKAWRGDVYLPTLLIHGARAAIFAASRRSEGQNVWLANLLNRRHADMAAVALADKTVGTVWALLAHGRDSRPDHVPGPIIA
jgi:hypothetical protein